MFADASDALGAPREAMEKEDADGALAEIELLGPLQDLQLLQPIPPRVSRKVSQDVSGLDRWFKGRGPLGASLTILSYLWSGRRFGGKQGERSYMGYWILKAILKPILTVLYGIKAEGLENVPKNGPAVLAANHVSFLDSFFLPLVIKGRKVTFLAKADYFKSRKTAWFFRM